MVANSLVPMAKPPTARASVATHGRGDGAAVVAVTGSRLLAAATEQYGAPRPRTFRRMPLAQRLRDLDRRVLGPGLGVPVRRASAQRMAYGLLAVGVLFAGLGLLQRGLLCASSGLLLASGVWMGRVAEVQAQERGLGLVSDDTPPSDAERRLLRVLLAVGLATAVALTAGVLLLAVDGDDPAVTDATCRAVGRALADGQDVDAFRPLLRACAER